MIFDCMGLFAELRVLRYFLTVVRAENISRVNGTFAYDTANLEPSTRTDGGRAGSPALYSWQTFGID